MTDIQIRRSPKQRARVWFNVVVTGGAGAWLIYDASARAETGWLIVGAFFLVWSAFMVYNLMKRAVYASADQSQVTVNSPFSSRSAKYSDMVWAKIDASDRAGIIVHRPQAAQKDQFIGLSIAALGDEGAQKLADVIAQHRPDLPTEQPQTNTDS